MRKIEKIIDCVSQVKSIIELVNYLPPVADIVTTQRIETLSREARNADFDDLTERERLESDFKKILLPVEVINHLSENSLNLISLGEAFQKYSDLLQAKRVLTAFAEINRDGQKQTESKAFAGYARMTKAYAFESKMREIRDEATWVLDGKFARPRISSFMRLFLECDIEIERIKLCNVCHSLFWATRINAPACSRKCSNAHHQRLFRNSSEQPDKNKKGAAK